MNLSIYPTMVMLPLHGDIPVKEENGSWRHF